MKKVYKTLTGLLLLSGALLWQCNVDFRPESMGLQHRVFVFADSLLWEQVGQEVELYFNDFVATPKAERSFIVNWKPLRELDDYKMRMNIFFLGTTRPGSEVNDYLLKIVPPEFIKNVNEDRNFYFFKDDLFARHQLSLFMIARDIPTFKTQFNRLKKQMLEGFRKRYFARLEKSMFDKAEQFKVEDILAESFGYRIRVQHDYFLATSDPETQYIWLRRVSPDRSVSIWRADSLPVNPGRMDFIRERDRMAKKYYSGDTVVTENVKLDSVVFAGGPAIKMTGSWVNAGLLVGGPFRTYFFKKESSGPYYALDISVMAPNKKKTPFLDQLEVIARSFSFAPMSGEKSRRRR